MSRSIVKIDRKYALWSGAIRAPITDFLSKDELVKELRENFSYRDEDIKRLFMTPLTARDVEQNRAGVNGMRLTKDELLAQYSPVGT